MPQLQPGLPPAGGGPQESGGNNPAVVAAMSRQRMGAPSAGTDPSQMSSGQGAQGAGQGVGFHLAQALQLFVQGGASPGDTEQIKQFFEAFVRIAEETQGQLAGQGAAPGGPQLGAGTAPTAPQPGAVPPPMPRM